MTNEPLDLDAYRDLVDKAVGGVLFNASNYPEKAQVRMLGQDTSPLREKVTDAVMETFEIFALIARVRTAEAERDEARLAAGHAYVDGLRDGQARAERSSLPMHDACGRGVCVMNEGHPGHCRT